MTASLLALTRASGEDMRRVTALLEAALPKAQIAKYIKGIEKLRRALEREYQPSLDAILRDLGRHVASVTAAKGGLVVDRPAAPTEAATSAPEVLDHPTLKERARVEAILKASDLPAYKQDKILPWIEKLYEGAWAGEYSLSQSTLESTERGKAIRAMLKEGGRRLGLIDLTENTKSALFRVIEFSREWEVGQPSPIQVAKWIQDEVPAGRFVNAGPKYRAQLIARTEIMHSTRMASIESAKADPHVTLLVAFDGDQDEQCAYRDGQSFTPEDANIESLATHPNCVLGFAPAYTVS